MISARRAALGAVLACTIAGLSAGCGDDEPGATPTVVEPEFPSAYMKIAVDMYDLTGPDDLRWSPVVQDGRRWTGDPRTYEEVCGADFLADDDTIPDLDGAADGGDSWYDQLRQDPERWAAFNAWLADPAVEAYVGDRADLQEGSVDRLDHGDFTDCEDAEEAGTPVE